MRIGMLIWTYWPGPEGGAERQCRGLVQELSRRGIERVVFTSWSGFGLAGRSHDGDTPVYRFGILCPLVSIFAKFLAVFNPKQGARSETYYQSLSFWLLAPVMWVARLSFIVSVMVNLRKNTDKVDLLHVQESSWLAGLAVWLGKQWGVPVLAKERSAPALATIGFDTPFRGKWNVLRKEAAYVALHAVMKDEILRKGVPEKRVTVIPNGVDVPETPIASNTRSDTEVLFVGNLSQGARTKAFDVLLEAWAKVSSEVPDARLTILGGGASGTWKALAVSLGCADTVHFEGSVSDPGMYYQRAALFVLPSRIEGMSNALLEAVAWGMPVVVSRIPGNEAVVEEGVSGRFVPVGDANALAESIIHLLRHPDIRGQLAVAAGTRAQREFSRSCVTDRLVNLYTSMIQEATT
jgi:glycosyltransferase involved in cell wall biosynthesis